MSSQISLLRRDITKVKADAIVNAANQTLLGGGGVDGAIHRAAGPELLETCRTLQGCRTGEAKITPGFQLPASYVIHTVGPIWRHGRHGEQDLLEQCYIHCLELALEHNLESIAFPNISTGVYAFPKALAAETAINAVQQFLSEGKAVIRVIFVAFDQENFTLYSSILEQYF